MPKFSALKEGVNEAVLASTQQKVEKYLGQLFHDHEIVKIDDFYTFTFGTITVTIQVLPWHSEDVLVRVYSYVGEEGVEVSNELRDELLRLNATIPFGSFGINFEKQAIFSYSLPGANLDYNEFEAAVQMVAKISDEYDEIIKGNAIAV
jgi:hypothetical protein